MTDYSELELVIQQAIDGRLQAYARRRPNGGKA